MLACPLTVTLADIEQSAPLVRGSRTLTWNGVMELAVPLTDVELLFRAQLMVQVTVAFCAGWEDTEIETDSGSRIASARKQVGLEVDGTWH
jgi:hypothetical protein